MQQDRAQTLGLGGVHRVELAVLGGTRGPRRGLDAHHGHTQHAVQQGAGDVDPAHPFQGNGAPRAPDQAAADLQAFLADLVAEGLPRDEPADEQAQDREQGGGEDPGVEPADHQTGGDRQQQAPDLDDGADDQGARAESARGLHPEGRAWAGGVLAPPGTEGPSLWFGGFGEGGRSRGRGGRGPPVARPRGGAVVARRRCRWTRRFGGVRGAAGRDPAAGPVPGGLGRRALRVLVGFGELVGVLSWVHQVASSRSVPARTASSSLSRRASSASRPSMVEDPA